MKKILFLLAAVSLGFVSCSDDDDKNDYKEFVVYAESLEYLGYETTTSYYIYSNDIETIDVEFCSPSWNAQIIGKNRVDITAPASDNVIQDGNVIIAAYDAKGNLFKRQQIVVKSGLLCDFENPQAEAVLAGPGADGTNLDGSSYVQYVDPVTGLTMGLNNGTWGQNFGAGGTAISRWNDIVTSGYTNQCSVYKRGQLYKDNGGHNESPTFSVNYYDTWGGAPIVMEFDGGAEKTIDHFWACNSTYTTLSMENGDNFSKKFTVDDWYKIVVKGYKADNTLAGEVEHYLADFRTNIVRSADMVYYPGIKYGWKKVDLSSLGEVSRIEISMDSSDKTDGIMNTPAYVCIDDIFVQ